MNATASPLLQPLCDSLAAIARDADARALRAHLEGRGLPIVGGDAEPAELILRALGESPDPSRLASDLAPPLARVIVECIAELNTEGLTPVFQLLLKQALSLATDLPANATLADSLRSLAASLEEAAPDFWFQAPLAPLATRALVYQQTDAQTEPLWIRLLETSGEGPWTPELRTVLLSAWRGLLHVPPDAEAARNGRVINMDRIERGLLALEGGVRAREGGLRLVRQALRVLTETFPRSPQFWEERLADRIDHWPTELRDEAVRQWTGLEQAIDAPPLVQNRRELREEQEKNLRKKEALCVRAEELSQSTQWKATSEAIKALQAEWKSIGPVPQKKADAIWWRFRDAICVFLDRQSVYFEQRNQQRDQRDAERRDQMLDALERKREQTHRLRESMARDEENVRRWQATLTNLRPGPSSEETRVSLEAKIVDVESRLDEKRVHLDELEKSIQEVAAKLLASSPGEKEGMGVKELGALPPGRG